MGRYRRVDVRIWGDEKVRRLSPMQPSGQGLWFYLLTNRYTTAIPGLYSAGEAAMAEDLGWTPKAFREAFGEVFREGLAKADWEARVVWIKGARKYNPPASPNVVRGWAATWDEVPECSLKTEAFWHLKAFTDGLGEAFAKAFGEACAQPLPNQDQDQDQDQEIPPNPPSPPRAARESESFDAFWQAYPRKVGKEAARKAWAKAAKGWALEADLLTACLAALTWQRISDDWRKDGGQFVPHAATYLNQGRWQDERPTPPVAVPYYPVHRVGQELSK